MTQLIKIVAVSVALALAPCYVVDAKDLKKMSLDEASSIGLKINTDTRIKAEGKGSVRVTTLWPTTVCLGQIDDLNVENAKLLFKARVKTELTEGEAFLEMWAYVGGGRYFSRGINDAVRSKTDWKIIQTPFILQKGQKAEKVTLNLVVNGKGTVWIDDVVLSKEPLR